MAPPEICDPKEDFLCKDGSCITYDKVCDRKHDCTYGEDELLSCYINECSFKNGHCSQKCIDLKIGFRCACEKGIAISVMLRILNYLLIPVSIKLLELGITHLVRTQNFPKK